jgi:hypothetical protein
VDDELLRAVDAAFEITRAGRTLWADPHTDRSPRDEEYSRLTHPERWRVLGARAEAWSMALVDARLAMVERAADVTWSEPPRTVISRADRVVPVAVGARPLVFARSGFGDVDDAGVTLGVGDPAVCVVWFPECGCDACDSGAQDEIDHLDSYVRAVLTGAFRRLAKGDQVITVLGDHGWRASNVRSRDVDALLTRPPRGWREVSGRSWFPV